jgi:hypothetical protein
MTKRRRVVQPRGRSAGARAAHRAQFVVASGPASASTSCRATGPSVRSQARSTPTPSSASGSATVPHPGARARAARQPLQLSAYQNYRNRDRQDRRKTTTLSAWRSRRVGRVCDRASDGRSFPMAGEVAPPTIHCSSNRIRTSKSGQVHQRPLPVTIPSSTSEIRCMASGRGPMFVSTTSVGVFWRSRSSPACSRLERNR